MAGGPFGLYLSNLWCLYISCRWRYYMYRSAGLKFSTKTYLLKCSPLVSVALPIPWHCSPEFLPISIVGLFLLHQWAQPRLSLGSWPRSFLFSDLTLTCGLSHHLRGTNNYSLGELVGRFGSRELEGKSGDSKIMIVSSGNFEKSGRYCTKF